MNTDPDRTTEVQAEHYRDAIDQQSIQCRQDPYTEGVSRCMVTDNS
ncbi:MAG TPA: hypothetical protein PLY87_15945 [Planctomycetaceae bacterium]|nr:hypothetical protein [Planctomycetaceae bacterium]HRA89216.1 hypothetical protein [Planctomycetaceae bacterium]